MKGIVSIYERRKYSCSSMSRFLGAADWPRFTVDYADGEIVSQVDFISRHWANTNGQNLNVCGWVKKTASFIL